MKILPSLALMAPWSVQCAAAPERTLLFLGDSLTAGHTLSPHETFPAHIERQISDAGLFAEWRVVNAGINGDTTAGGLARLPSLLRRRPDVVFVCLGANDGLRGMPPHEVERNLVSIVEQARSSGARVVLGGMRSPYESVPALSQYSSIYPRLAHRFNLPFLPFLLEGVALQPGYVLSDGVHPNAEATRRIAENVWSVIEPVLRVFEPEPH